MGCMINFQVFQLYDKKEVILGHEGTSKPVHCVCNEQPIADWDRACLRGMGEWKEKGEFYNTNKQIDTVKLQGIQLSPQWNMD